VRFEKGFKFDERIVVGDFNGDGKTDYAQFSPAKTYLFIS